MKHNIFFKALVLALLVAGGGKSQAQENIMLRLRTFLNYYPVPCDSIEVSNTTQGTHTTLYYPDTVLTNYNVGIEEFASESGNLQLAMLSSNPFADKAELCLSLPHSAKVELSLTNILGQQEMKRMIELPKGQHRFTVRTNGNGLHIFSVRANGEQCSVKLLQEGGMTRNAELEWTGCEGSFSEKELVSSRSQFDFTVGDHLVLTTHANAHYYDTITPITQTVELNVTESGTVNFRSFHTFENNLNINDSVELRNTVWDVLASVFFNYYTCLEYFATDMGEEIESRVTFYDSTFCSIKHAGGCDASYYGGMPLRLPWIYGCYEIYHGKYRVEYEHLTNNMIVAHLYVGDEDTPCSQLEYHYSLGFTRDHNLLEVYDETYGTDAIMNAYLCKFRKAGRVE